MQVKIIVFGQLVDIINSSELTLSDISDTNTLQHELNKRYPSLANANFMMAVDKQTVQGNTILKENSTVALLPPFSGG